MELNCLKRKISLKSKPSRPRLDLLGRILELPPGMSGGSHIEVFSNREAIVDGCRGVMEYDESGIRLNVGTGTVRVFGRGLSIDSFGEGQVVIKGFIQNVEFGIL